MPLTHGRPNVLLIITDHHAFRGHDRSSGLSNGPLQMPNYARLAGEGVHFDQAYSVSPICTPARASMMTGLYPSSHGLRWNTGSHLSRQTDFSSGQRLYSHHLAEAGYRNAYVGKWHCSLDRLPVDYGIEGWSLPDYGKPYMDQAYQDYAESFGHHDARARIEHSIDHPEWEGQTLTLHHPSPYRFMKGAGVLEGPPEVHEQQFTAHLVIAKLRELVKAQRETGQPWSLVASFWGPHPPYYPSEPYASMFDPAQIPEYPTFRDDYSGNRPLRAFLQRDLHHGSAARWPDWRTWQEVLARCYGQIMQTDAAVGQILDALDDEGISDRTLVMWVADHGDAVASHGGLWDKGSTYNEEVARIPMALRWPETIPAGLRTRALVTNMDVTATILDAAGLPIPDTMHSRSVLPVCHGDDASLSDHVIAEHNGFGEDILQRIVLTGRYKYVAALYDKDELYDLHNDPYETVNLIDDPTYSSTNRELRGLLIDHMERTRDHAGQRLLHSLKLVTRA